jgi:hypothetical protein
MGGLPEDCPPHIQFSQVELKPEVVGMRPEFLGAFPQVLKWMSATPHPIHLLLQSQEPRLLRSSGDPGFLTAFCGHPHREARAG